MHASTYSFPARYFALLVDYLESNGVDRDALLRAARIRTFGERRGDISLAQAEALLEAAERTTGRRDLGFELGKLIKLTSHEILGYALLTSASLREVLRLLSQYQRLITPAFALKLEYGQGTVDLVYRPVVALSLRSMRIVQEAIAVSNHFEIRALLQGRLPPYDLYFSVERPAHAARYRELSPARVHFGAPMPGLRMSLDAALLDVPLATADPWAKRAAEDRCKALLDRSRGRSRWSDWCRMMLREAEDSRPTLEELAGFVNLSSRTLSRYLAVEDEDFRALSLQVRTERACRMLESDTLPVTAIAYRLGYSDVANFVRAFRQQTGRTPGAYAAHARTGGAAINVRDRRRPGARRGAARGAAVTPASRSRSG
jgi:AraC-like DNA-binding protein